MGSISHHITPLVINSLGAGTHTHTRIPTFVDKAILRNQVCLVLEPCGIQQVQHMICQLFFHVQYVRCLSMRKRFLLKLRWYSSLLNRLKSKNNNVKTMVMDSTLVRNITQNNLTEHTPKIQEAWYFTQTERTTN